MTKIDIIQQSSSSGSSQRIWRPSDPQKHHLSFICHVLRDDHLHNAKTIAKMGKLVHSVWYVFPCPIVDSKFACVYVVKQCSVCLLLGLSQLRCSLESGHGYFWTEKSLLELYLGTGIKEIHHVALEAYTWTRLAWFEHFSHANESELVFFAERNGDKSWNSSSWKFRGRPLLFGNKGSNERTITSHLRQKLKFTCKF